MDTSLILAAIILAPALTTFGWVVYTRRFEPAPRDPWMPPWVLDDAPGQKADDEPTLGHLRFEVTEPDEATRPDRGEPDTPQTSDGRGLA